MTSTVKVESVDETFAQKGREMSKNRESSKHSPAPFFLDLDVSQVNYFETPHFVTFVTINSHS